MIDMPQKDTEQDFDALEKKAELALDVAEKKDAPQKGTDNQMANEVMLGIAAAVTGAPLIISIFAGAIPVMSDIHASTKTEGTLKSSLDKKKSASPVMTSNGKQTAKSITMLPGAKPPSKKDEIFSRSKIASSSLKSPTKGLVAPKPQPLDMLKKKLGHIRYEKNNNPYDYDPSFKRLEEGLEKGDARAQQKAAQL